MAPIRYSLHYEDYSEHLMSRFGKLLQMQSLVDMTLMCSSHTLRVHKAVLAASSAYFQEVLQKQTGEPLIILKMRFCVLKCLIEFMYCGKTQCLEENLDELVSAAQFFKIKGLSKVTKEGLGIASHGEPPVFTPPVVISRPPQSFIGVNAQDNDPRPPQLTPPQLTPASGTNQAVDYTACKNKRSGWNGTGGLGRAAERALLRREQDSRKAIHQLKHLQNKHMQDYMDRVTLSEAVNSICGPETSTSHNYMNIDADLMCIDQSISSNVLDPNITYTKKTTGSETITSSYSTAATSNSASDTTSTGIGTAMSQYVNALKDAGLPTDLPILFESGDGSYINVNEQVLLDMVQSSEIQYEVIEQPNIIEKVADPGEIKSIDDLSKSIERGEIHLGSKSYTSSSNYSKDATQFINEEETINSLNAILPDNLESFAEQQNYVVLDSRLQEHANDFSCIDGDMQYFTKSMSDDIKKYYEEQHLNDTRATEQFCPTSTTLGTNFSISLLDSKNSHLNADLSQQYNPLNPDDLRRNEDCYDFGLQLPQSADFKEDALDCLMSTPKQTREENTNYNADNEFHKTAQEQVDIIKDLMNTEDNVNKMNVDNATEDFSVNSLNVDDAEFNMNDSMNTSKPKIDMEITSSDLQWNNIDINDKENIENYNIGNKYIVNSNQSDVLADTQFQNSVIDLTEVIKEKTQTWEGILNETDMSNNDPEITNDSIASTLESDIPYAVGLLPLKQIQPTECNSLLKRKKSNDAELNDKIDTKCLKRKVKYKNM